ncbi:hypothetical protein [Corynebacterium durum]|uniref:hypothetical protein n=1 Tax=Corynebacterium durum TaxID=61592 RepID=UPI0028E70E6C|nr:hypothetical protein [Corynebacterium durum]
MAARLTHAWSKRDTIETLIDLGTTPKLCHHQKHLPRFATSVFRDQVTTALARFASIGLGVITL